VNSTANDQEKSTGLPFPKTWNGAYVLVLVNFVVWIFLLIALRLFTQ
jgi:hypothetical protein